METEKHNWCMCPRCQDGIAEQFYCCTCGYLPDWPRRESEDYEVGKQRRNSITFTSAMGWENRGPFALSQELRFKVPERKMNIQNP